VLPVALFTAPNHICPGTCTNFTSTSLNATSFTWIFSGAVPGTSVDENPSGICYNSPGQYGVTLIVGNSAGADTLSLPNFITVYPYPPPQGIAQSGDTLYANGGAVSYQWYFSGVLIPGATEYYFVVTDGGSYNVVCTDANGCEVEAAIFDVPALTNELSGWNLTLAPNPVTDVLNIRSAFNRDEPFVFTVYNALGEKIISASAKQMTTDVPVQLDCRSLPAGIYFLELAAESKSLRTKFIRY
jgi:PKD repeat protein